MQLYWEENNAAIIYSSKQWKHWVSFTFKGSEIRFMGAQGWDHGSFRINLDGIETTVDGYCCGPNGGMPQIIQFEATNLNRQSHTVNITNLSRGPRGTVLEVDAFIVTPHASRITQIRDHLPFIFLFVIMACCFFIRRRLSKFSVLEASLPLSAPVHPPTFNARPRSPPPPPPRSGKNGYHYLAQETESDQGGASSSHMQNPPEYSPAPVSSGESGGRQQSGHPYPAPLDYGFAPGTQVDDDLVDRIAQRVAGLVHASQSPPRYEGPSETDR